MPDDAAIKTAEAGEKEIPPTPEKEAVKVDTSKPPEAKVDETKKEQPAAPKHAKAEDRIKYLWKENKTKESLLLEKEQKIKQLEGDLEKSKLTSVPRPKREQFETEESFLEAYETYLDKKQEVRLSELDAKRRDDRAKVEYQDAWTPFQHIADKLDDEHYPDLDKAVVGDGVVYSMLSREFVRTSPTGPQLAYHFYQHPDVAETLAKLPIAQQTQALIDLQSELIRANETKKAPSAPAPINPVGQSGGIVEQDEDKMGVDDWMTKRRKEKKIR